MSKLRFEHLSYKKTFKIVEQSQKTRGGREKVAPSAGEVKKRSKTFTGCFTCRSRKIRCDLTRPQCQKCFKSGLECSGYDIKLRWSQPIQFVADADSITSSQVTFGKKQEGEGDEAEYFQRRTVDFVKWEKEKRFKPYETYGEMDRDLSVLNNSQNDQRVRGLETKVRGPFGVFLNSPRTRKRAKTALTTGSTHSKGQTSFAGAKTGLTPKQSHKVSSSFGIPPSTDNIASHDHLWLSNELRDDALLTAAALNGDSQFLDLMNNISPSHSDTLTPGPDSKSNIYYGNNNRNDFLNLVFHRNNTLGSAGNAADDNTANTPSNLSNNGGITSPFMLQGDSTSNVFIDPTNQNLFYSNYNNYYYNNPYKSNENLEIQLHASKISNRANETNTDIIGGATTEMPSSLMCIVQNPLQPKLGFNLAISLASMGMPTTALQVQPLTRYLLNYYNTQVADLMTVIPLTENPWKSVYFPRALMAIGELLALGKTSNARNALLNALLAVLAFNLQSKFPKNSEQMKYYLNLGVRLRNQASLFVKNLLGSNSNSKPGIENCIMNEKYKDVLCAVMSMISVDLVWGTMQDTNFYITWCGKVIAAKMANKKKLSSRARILHRIFLSLKLIQDLTCLDLDNIKDEIELTNVVVTEAHGTKTSVEKSVLDIINSVTHLSSQDDNAGRTTSPSFVNKKLINTKKNDENFATDALYGLPNSLITLFNETVQLLRLKIYHQGTTNILPDDFANSVDALGSKLSQWKLDWKLYEKSDVDVGVDANVEATNDANVEANVEATNDSNKQFLSAMHEATYHHIMSFYHALTIYFSRLIKNTPPQDLQLHVTQTLTHLNSIQTLIARGDASMIPLFWQGFIAGCEATSPELQLEFKKWGADISQYLGSYWGARQIMLEVWRRKSMQEPNDDWVSVIKDWEMNLMLN